MKKILLTLLAVFMFATVGTANVLTEDSPKFDSYISFGDSFTRGMGANQEHILGDEDDATNMDIRIVDGAYTTQIAEYYNIIPSKEDNNYGGQKNFGSEAKTNYYPTSVFGLKLEGGLHLVKGDRYATGEDWSEGGILTGYIEKMFELFGYNQEGNKGSEGHVDDLISDGGNALITVNLGLADVIFDASTSTMGMYDITKALENPEELVNFLIEFGKQSKAKYDVWAKNYEEFIKTIKALNKKSTIVLIGFMNPLREVCISDDVMLPLGSISDPVIALMNETSRFLAKKYGCIYVDITNGESMAIEKEWTISGIQSGGGWSVLNNFLAAIHPSPRTMDYIAREVEEAIDNRYSWFKPSSDIRVDLIRNTKEDISLVVLDGKVVDDYNVNGTTLTIDTKDKNAKVLQVFFKEENDAIGVRTYVLMYRDGKYVSYCLDSTNDAKSRTSKIVTPIIKAIDQIIDSNEQLKQIKEMVENYIKYKKLVDEVSDKIDKFKEASEKLKELIFGNNKKKEETEIAQLEISN